MPADYATLLNEIRYAERLCNRTARLYRRLQGFGVFMTIVGGSAALLPVSSAAPAWMGIGGALVFMCFGAALLSIRPADKAAANEQDARRYAQLRSRSRTLDAAQLQAALDQARESDAAEVEPLRDVAWNDMVREIGCPGDAVQLRLHQRVLATLA